MGPRDRASHRSSPPRAGPSRELRTDDLRKRSADRAGVELDAAARQRIRQLGDRAAKELAAFIENRPPYLVGWQFVDDDFGLAKHFAPAGSQSGGVRDRASKCELPHLGRVVTSRSPSLGQDQGWVVARILPARRPSQIAEALQAFTGFDDVDPVANFDAPDQREHLVGHQVKRVQGQAKVWMFDEGEEPVGTVTDPLDDNALVLQPSFSLTIASTNVGRSRNTSIV